MCHGSPRRPRALPGRAPPLPAPAPAVSDRRRLRISDRRRLRRRPSGRRQRRRRRRGGGTGRGAGGGVGAGADAGELGGVAQRGGVVGRLLRLRGRLRRRPRPPLRRDCRRRLLRRRRRPRRARLLGLAGVTRAKSAARQGGFAFARRVAHRHASLRAVLCRAGPVYMKDLDTWPSPALPPSLSSPFLSPPPPHPRSPLLGQVWVKHEEEPRAADVLPYAAGGDLAGH